MIWSLMFLPNRQCQCHPYSICTCYLHIVCTDTHCQCMLSTHVYIICLHIICQCDLYIVYICICTVIYICTHHILSGHMHTIHTLPTVVLDMFLPNRQCQCHPYVISSTLYISYHIQLSFCTLSAQTHIVNVYLDVVHTCIHHLLVIFTMPHIPYYPQLSFCTLSTHIHIVNAICILFRNAYVMYMSSLLLLFVYVHVIYILSGHICIMCTLSAVVLDMFLPSRQC